jgi:hypothetical protein
MEEYKTYQELKKKPQLKDLMDLLKWLQTIMQLDADSLNGELY